MSNDELRLAILAIIACIQLPLIYFGIRTQHEWNRRNNSLNYSFSDDPKMIEILRKLDQYFHITRKETREIPLEEINNLVKGEEKNGEEIEPYTDVYNDIHFALARLESMCIAMKHNVANETICKDMLRTRVITFHHFFRKYIVNARHIRGSDDVFRYVEEYAKKWDHEKPSQGLTKTGKL